MTKQVYIGASLGNMGARLQNEITKGKVKNAGLKPYLPQDDKSINDKKNAVQEGLAERIVDKDFGAIDDADVLLFDITETPGTTAELGSVYGQKRLANQLLDMINDDERDSDLVLEDIKNKLNELINKPVLFQCTDLRSQNKSLQSGFRREWGLNQLVYGVVLALSNGKGFIEQDELENALKELNN